jgi:vesicle coat complex subunit
MNQARTDTNVDLIRLWISSLSIDFKKSSEIISLPEETLMNLLKQLIILHISKGSKKGYNIKSITKKEKKTLELRVNHPGFNSILETFFYKKKVNSSWTYLKFRGYHIKWAVSIHLITSDSKKSYDTTVKKKTQNKEPITRKQFIKFSDYFEQEYDT